MTEMLQTLLSTQGNKIRITITLSEKTFCLLENEVKHAKKLNNSWNRSKLVDTILNYELSNVLKQT